MNSDQKTAIIVGILFLVNFVANLIGSTYVEAILEKDYPDYLVDLHSNETLVVIAELLEVMCAAALVGIAIMMLPILKRHNEHIAHGFLTFRILEAAMMVVSISFTLALLTLSEDYDDAGTAADASYETLGAFAVAGRYWAFKMVLIFLILGALMFYYLLYQTQLVPRFISLWALIAVTLIFGAVLLEMLGVSAFSYDEFPGTFIYLFGAPYEPVLGIWLIIKGFNPAAIDSGAT